MKKSAFFDDETEPHYDFFIVRMLTFAKIGWRT